MKAGDFLTEKKETMKPTVAELEFTKEQLLDSDRYRGRKDLVSALLQGEKIYTCKAVDNLIDNFMKGKVK